MVAKDFFSIIGAQVKLETGVATITAASVEGDWFELNGETWIQGWALAELECVKKGDNTTALVSTETHEFHPWGLVRVYRAESALDALEVESFQNMFHEYFFVEWSDMENDFVEALEQRPYGDEDAAVMVEGVAA